MPATAVIPDDDEDGILGEHDESDEFFAAGKEATLYVAWMTSETFTTLPQDRKRKKLGVGEKVSLTLKPASLPSPSWKLVGHVGTSEIRPTEGIMSELTAGERVCGPVPEATIKGKKVKIDFNVVEPDGVTIKQEIGSNIWHIRGKGSAGFLGQAYITPNDVSFARIETREQTCAGVGTGYFAGSNGRQHPLGQWVYVVEGDEENPSASDALDEIRTDANNPPFSTGNFDWPIPWQFRVLGGGEKTFTTVTHHEEISATGKTTISKGGTSISRELNDPTSNFNN
jgi:hypothetical protein